MKSFLPLIWFALSFILFANVSSVCLAEEILYDSIKIFVDDAIITKNEIEVRLFEELNRKKIPVKNQDKIAKMRVEVTERLIEDALLNSRADALRIHISDDVLENELDYFRSQRKLTESAFEDLLDRQQISLISFKKTYANRMRRNQVISREIRSKIEISNERLREIYDKKEGEFLEVRAKHIFKKVPANAEAQDKEKMKQQIIWVTDQIKNGKNFEEMALKYSDDPSVKSNKGDLGYFKKDEILKAVSDISFILPVNTLSEPILSELGYHLLVVTDKKKAEKKSFKEMREQIHQEAYQKIFPEVYKKYIDKLKEKSVIKYN